MKFVDFSNDLPMLSWTKRKTENFFRFLTDSRLTEIDVIDFFFGRNVPKSWSLKKNKAEKCRKENDRKFDELGSQISFFQTSSVRRKGKNWAERKIEKEKSFFFPNRSFFLQVDFCESKKNYFIALFLSVFDAETVRQWNSIVFSKKNSPENEKKNEQFFFHFWTINKRNVHLSRRFPRNNPRFKQEKRRKKLVVRFQTNDKKRNENNSIQP